MSTNTDTIHWVANTYSEALSEAKPSIWVGLLVNWAALGYLYIFVLSKHGTVAEANRVSNVFSLGMALFIGIPLVVYPLMYLCLTPVLEGVIGE